MNSARISSHPTFRRLCFERNCLGITLAVAMATAYFAYVLAIAFRPELLGTAIRDGSIVTWGIAVGVAILGLGFVLTVIYVLVANMRLDALNRRLREDLR